jgi:hypothetical protein
LLATREFKSSTVLESCILMFCHAFSYLMSCIKPIFVFNFFAAYLDNPVSHRHVDGNGSSFFTATLEMCGNFLRAA